MTDDRRRFPWANAHRIADDHDREVSELETAGFADLAAAFPNGIVYMDGMRMDVEGDNASIRVDAPKPTWETAPRGPYLIFDGALSPGQQDKVREMLVDGYSPREIMATVQPTSPGRWRWERDPIVIGAAIGLVIVLVIFLSVVP